MEFNLSEEQEMLKKMARDFLTENCPKSLVREMEEDEKGHSVELWRKMAELGWMGLIIPEEYGGIEGSFLDLAVLLEEMGRAPLPGPFFSTVVLGELLLLEVGNKEQKQEYLTKAAQGQVILTLALNEAESDLDPDSMTTTAVAKGDEYIISGTKMFVPDAHVSDYIICAARTSEGVTLFLVDTKSSGIQCNLLQTTGGDKQCEVVFNEVKVPTKNILGEVNKGWSYIERWLPKAMVAKSVEILGGIQETLEMTADYAKDRMQFDQLIGSFQAIQHHCSNMMIDVNGSRFLAYRVAWMISEGIPCTKECYITKAWVSDASQRVVVLGTQVQGGTGIMKEGNMQFYFRRQRVAEVMLGSSDFCREKVAQEMHL